MANTGFLSTSDLDFQSIKQNLKTYLNGQSQFQDYDFDGSNMSVLLDLLAYNTYLNSHYLNAIGSEMFLDTAQIKESVVSHAKELNYIPRSRTSAKATVNITINAGSDNPNFITIPKGYVFTTQLDNTAVKFSTPGAIVVRSVNGVYAANDVEIYEGELVTEYFTYTSGTRFVLKSENIDTNSIDVTIINSNTDSTSATWLQAESLYGLDEKSKIFFVQGSGANQYELVFGNNQLGKALNNGNIVKVQYRDTIGADGNGAYQFKRTSSIDGYTDITVQTTIAATEGSEREDTSSIKYNAVRHFTTQERGVTGSDFINLVKAKFPQLQAVTAYGGEEASPPQYGRVIISVKPYGTTATISDNLKNEISSYVKSKTLTTLPVIEDPKFIYASINTTVYYNALLSTRTQVELKSLINENIVSLNDSYLTNFGSDLRYSKLTSVIDATDPAIVGNNTRLLAAKRWSPTAGATNSFSFSFGNELAHEDVLYKLPTGHTPALYSLTPFKYLKDGTLYDAFLSDDGLGTIYVYALVDDINNTRAKVILNETAGTVDYYTGDVIINTDVVTYIGSYISIYAALQKKDIVADKNMFIIIDPADITISIESVTV